MSPGSLSEPARTLVRQHIDSVGLLDLLIILYGDPRSGWSAGRMAKQMRTSAKWAAAQMQTLQRAGILGYTEAGGEPVWSYAPADDALDDAVRDLVEACRLDWPEVTREVMSLRGSGAQAFSDAFRLRKRDG